MDTFDLFVAASASSVQWRAKSVTWDDVLGWARNPADHKECGGYVFGRFRGTARRTSELIDRCVLALDVDVDGGPIPGLVSEMGARALVHDTFSSAPDHIKKRILLPLSRRVTGAEYEVLAEAVAQHLGTQRFDRTSFRPAQFMWKPGTANAAWYAATPFEGEDLDPDQWIPKYDRELAAASLQGPRRVQKRDPFELEGVIGAFNRAYGHDLAALVERFGLPYEEEAPDRFRYKDSVSVAGMGPVRDAPGLFYSHHATDEAGGQTCSAFDLVRIHMFGEEDMLSKPGTPITKLPSHTKMTDYVKTDEAVRMEQLRDLFKDDLSADETLDPALADADAQHNANAWRMGLTVNKANKVLSTPENLELIRGNDRILTRLAFNDMTKSVEVTEPFPWDTSKYPQAEIQPADDHFIRDHLLRTYRLTLTDRELSGLILMAAYERRINPLRDLLLGLEWDGVERLDDCLPGVHSTIYTRLAARKALLGAVARALDPGCQMDYSLILSGREGVGKSRWIRRMALRPEWYGELDNISQKDTLLTMAKKWIMVSDEVDAMRRSDFNQLKSFLTKTHDNFRIPYAVNSSMYPRHCAIWGTTNDPRFLRRQEGNRRFLIVECVEKDERCLDPEWVEQVWAEAVACYLAGEQIYMTDEESAVASAARDGFTQDDPLAGKIVAYLDMLVPIEWATMNSDQRAMWYRLDRFLSEGVAVQNIVCAQAIVEEVLGLKGFAKDFEIAGINNILREIEGWGDGGIRVTDLYGPQHVFVRTKNYTPETSGRSDLI